MNPSRGIFAAILVLLFAGTAFAGLTSAQKEELGTTLTPIGAEKAGSADGVIPPYTGGLATAPQGYVKGSGIFTDPFASEKPLFSINAKNMAQYADKLTAGTKELMKRYPNFRIDVYKTHPNEAFPKFVFENTKKNAGKASCSSDGLVLKAPPAGYPFPIPKNGVEAMWNHQLKFAPTTSNRARSYTVDSAGHAYLASELNVTQEFPFWNPSMKDGYYMKLKIHFSGPPRRNGEGMMLEDSIDRTQWPRRAWQYLPGQRRVKLAPDIGWDTPDPSTSGATTFDDNFIYNGPMGRFNWKLVGKKEVYVPYNDYKLAFHSTKSEVLGDHFVNPDYVRWELHRVWVVEATLKPGKRHIYHHRVFYLDEDSWQAVSSDEYDAHEKLFRSGFVYMQQLYTYPSPLTSPFVFYDYIGGRYNFNAYTAETGGCHFVESPPGRFWTPGSLAGSGIR